MPRSPSALARRSQACWVIGLTLLTFALLCPRAPVPVAQAQVIVGPPVFSVAHGFFSSSFQLTLTSATPGATIRYTTDFSTPTPTKGTIYAQPITISGTRVVRAIAYTSTTNKSAIVTQTYIFPAQVSSQSNNPGNGWPSTFAASNTDGGPYPAYYEMAPEIVSHPNNAGQMDAALRGLPAISLVTDLPNLWDSSTGIYYNSSEKGQDWERAASLEWIDPTGATLGFSENAGVRIHGQTTRRPHRTPKRTFRIYFNADYGNTKLDFKLFDDNDAVSQFDRILLRGGGNRSWPYYDRDLRRESDYINDEFARRAFLAMGGLAGHGTFAHLYLDGQYWGLYNVTERMDGRFLEAYLGGVETDYDLIAPDEENNYVPGADPGTIDAWNQLHALLNVASVSDALYQQVQQRLDVVDLADYSILLHYIANTDWPAHNWYAYRKRSGDDTRFRMMPWDSDTALNRLDADLTSADAPDTPARLFLKLATNAEFRQLVADRFYRHLVNANGQLTPASCGARYGALAATIDPAIIGESARWGAYARKVYPQITYTLTNTKALPAYFYSRDMPTTATDPTDEVPDAQQKTWLQVRDTKLNSYCPQRTAVVLNQYLLKGWYQTDVKPPAFGQEGGAVPAGYNLTIDNTPNNNVGTIYYTVDGSDPRQTGGAIAATAINGGSAANVIISQVTTVKARALNGNTWSPLHEATFYPPQPFADLVINEIHYHPAAPVGVNGDDFEFVELYNKGNTALRLDNLHFSRGFTYHFPPGTSLAAGAYFTLSPNATAFAARYGFAPSATLRGNLSNRGEALELVDALGTVIDFVDYQDVPPWPTTPDGTGPSLWLSNPSLDNSLAASWAASAAADGTPGQANGITPSNQPPAVTVSSPAPNANFTVGAPVTMEAQASDSDGTVQKVVFYANGALLCSDADPPYACQFSPQVGNYGLTAQATDDDGATTSSLAVPIVVNPPPNQPPLVAITAPGTNATFTQGMTVLIEAQAGDNDGSLQKVEFYGNGGLLCTATSAPYTCQFTPAVGNHALTAQATDDDGATTLSSAVPIVVNPPSSQPPLVTITTPVTNTTFTQGMMVTIEAQASDPDGIVQTVEFYANGALLCTVTSAPYTCQFSPQVGDHLLTAQATDDDGAKMTSLAVSIVVNPAPNQPPVVIITSPVASAIFTQGETVAIEAQASDPDGVVQQVLFYANDEPLCIDTSAPYRCQFVPSTGNYVLTAQATDERSATTTSPAVPIVVNPAPAPGPNQPPVVAILSPSASAVFTVGVTVTIEAQANDPDSAVQQVEFYANDQLLCTDTLAPYTCAWTPAVGVYALRLIAASGDGRAEVTIGDITVQEVGGTGDVTRHAYLPLVMQ